MSGFYERKRHGHLTLTGDINLPLGRVHEVMGDSADMFAILIAAQLQGPVVWIGRAGDVDSLAPTAMQAFLNPARMIVIEATSRKEILWSSEQAMRMASAGCVIAELHDGPDLWESRRLQIAAEQSGSLGLVLIAHRAQTSAAQTRWCCVACADEGASWIWRLIKNRSGLTGTWRVNYWVNNQGNDNAPGVIHLVAATAA